MLRNVAANFIDIVLMIAAKGDGRALAPLGTGFVCHKSGAVLTCAHNVSEDQDLCVIPVDTTEEFPQRIINNPRAIAMKLSQIDRLNDVALLTPRDSNFTSNVSQLIFGNVSQVPIGSSVAYIGFPYMSKGLHVHKISQSVVCGKSSNDSGTRQLHVDANVHSGNSGGPVIDLMSNSIIGIVTERFSPTGSEASVTIGDFPLGQDSTISFATEISYGISLLKAEDLYD